jgi:regulator of replication initiation timing
MASKRPAKKSQVNDPAQQIEREVRRAKKQIAKAKKEIGELLKKSKTSTLDKSKLEAGLNEVVNDLDEISFWDYGG